MDKTTDTIKPFDFKDIYGFIKNSGSCFSKSAYKILFSNVVKNEYYYDYLYFKAKYMQCEPDESILTSSYDYEKFLMKTINIVYENSREYIDFESIINTSYYPSYLKLDVMADYLKKATYDNTIDSFNTNVTYHIYNELSKYNTPNINKVRKDFLYKVFCDVATSVVNNIRCTSLNEIITIWINEKYMEYISEEYVDFHSIISESKKELEIKLKNTIGFNFSKVKVRVQKYITNIKNKTTMK